MFFCLRVDLDYVPWDNPDAAEFGHGEPAVVLRLLDLARDTGCKFHFFASTRVLRAFPATVAAVLDEGHDLDWLCKHPEWPEGASAPDSGLRFISATSGETPPNIRLFQTSEVGDRVAMRSGLTARK